MRNKKHACVCFAIQTKQREMTNFFHTLPQTNEPRSSKVFFRSQWPSASFHAPRLHPSACHQKTTNLLDNKWTTGRIALPMAKINQPVSSKTPALKRKKRNTATPLPGSKMLSQRRGLLATQFTSRELPRGRGSRSPAARPGSFASQSGSISLTNQTPPPQMIIQTAVVKVGPTAPGSVRVDQAHRCIVKLVLQTTHNWLAFCPKGKP